MAVVALLACGSASAANLVTNGSFEAPDVVGGSYVLCTTGSTAITGWTVFAVGNYIPFGPSTIGLSISGGPEQLFANPSVAANPKSPMNWASFSVEWVADANSAQLSFLGRANGALSNNAGIGLDNVMVEQIGAPVPEPGTYALMAFGLGMLALTARRRSV